MHTFECNDCDTSFEKKRPMTCRDGKHRCTKCQNALKSKKYQQTSKGKEACRRSVKKFRKTDAGHAMRNRWQRRYYWKTVEWQRMKKRAYQHGLKARDLLELFDKQSVCQMCNSVDNLSIDHMHPQHRGGDSNLENLQALCLSCNVWKSNKLFLANGSGYLVGDSYGW
jgi:5-methylcytosine-specific restriction endonuclease McrA